MRAQIAGGAVLAGVGIGVGVASTAVRRARQKAEANFYAWEEIVPPPEGSGVVGTFPVFIHRADVFGAVFPADLQAVTEILPSERLHPVRTPDGHALIGVQGVRFHEMTCQHIDGPTLVARPYGQVIVGVLVTQRSAPPILPLLPMASSLFAAGVFPLHAIATTREARDADRVMGFPTFIGDLDFEDDVTTRRVRVSDAGEDILDLALEITGTPSAGRQKQSWYTVVDGRLNETQTRLYGFTQGRIGGTAKLELGMHVVADDLRRFRIVEKPLMVVAMSSVRGIMPAPEPLGPARAHAWFPGRDVDLGRYTVQHPHTERVDQYGPVGMDETAAVVNARLRPLGEPAQP